LVFFWCAQRCVLGSEQLRVAQEGKRMGGAEPRVAAWTPKMPAPEARLAALPRELRDSRMKIFSGTANRPLAQVGSLTLFVHVRPLGSVSYYRKQKLLFSFLCNLGTIVLYFLFFTGFKSSMALCMIILLIQLRA